MTTGSSLASPRLAALKQELEAGNAAALEAFWQEVSQQGTPLIEPIPGNDQESLVTFLWRASQEIESVAVVSNLSGQLGASETMARLPGTDLWYKTYRLPGDTRESYQFAVGGEHLTDPLNARQFIFPGDPEIDLIGWVSSVLELPGAPPQPWIAARPGVPQGQVSLHRMRNDALDYEYRVWVYTPPGYTPDGAPYGWLLMFDGWFYLTLAPTPTILDNLLADGRLPPLIAILVGHPWDPYRRRDLACYPPFEQFLTHDIVPWARQNYHLTGDPAQTAVVGASLGGLMAAYIGLRHADSFGHVLAQSGHFGWKPSEGDEDGWIVRQYAASPRLPLRFYVEAGLFETAIPSPLPGNKNFLVSARRMRDALLAKGYPVHYAEFSGGHNPINYRGTLADGLLSLLGRWRSS
jgi:enterochelin esterase family protein